MLESSALRAGVETLYNAYITGTSLQEG